MKIHAWKNNEILSTKKRKRLMEIQRHVVTILAFINRILLNLKWVVSASSLVIQLKMLTDAFFLI